MAVEEKGARERCMAERRESAAKETASSERDKEGVRVHRSINQDNERQVEARRTSRQRRKGGGEEEVVVVVGRAGSRRSRRLRRDGVEGWKEGRTQGRTEQRLYETFDTSTKPLPTIPKIRNLTVNLARAGLPDKQPDDFSLGRRRMIN